MGSLWDSTEQQSGKNVYRYETMELCLRMNQRQGSQLDANSEAALIERCRRNDDEAFGKLVDAYQARVFGFVKKMIADRDEAMDLTQETFIRAYQGIGRFDGRSSIRTWLFRIAHNLCVDRARRLDRRPQEVFLENSFDSEESVDVPDQRWNPEGDLLDEELHKVVQEGIASMSEKLRSVLLLHDKENMQYEEIAEVLNIPVGTVKSRLFLARNHLQSVLKNYFAFGGETI